MPTIQGGMKVSLEDVQDRDGESEGMNLNGRREEIGSLLQSQHKVALQDESETGKHAMKSEGDCEFIQHTRFGLWSQKEGRDGEAGATNGQVPH
jgi:hypothetical protein